MVLVQFSRSVMSNSMTPWTAQHARPPCLPPTPGVHPNPCPSSRWCHPTISSSVVPFSSCPQSFPASGCFPMSQFFATSGKSIGVSASASVFPTNTQDWSPLGWDWLDLLAVQGALKSLLRHHSSEASVCIRSLCIFLEGMQDCFITIVLSFFFFFNCFLLFLESHTSLISNCTCLFFGA